MYKIIAVAGIFLVVVILVFVCRTDYDICYSQMENEGYATMGMCGGQAGGTSATDYLSEQCIGCPHLTLPYQNNEDKKDGN